MEEPVRAPYSKEELIAEFVQAGQEVKESFGELSVSDFRRSINDAWSPSQILHHLIRSTAPVSTALGLPKLLLAVLFGKPAGGSRSYFQIKDSYLHELSKGAKATGRYVPPGLPPASITEDNQTRIIEKWTRVNSSLVRSIGIWKDEDLDVYRLPHPILGKLTIREMLFFTLYHLEHHLRNMRTG